MATMREKLWSSGLRDPERGSPTDNRRGGNDISETNEEWHQRTFAPWTIQSREFEGEKEISSITSYFKRDDFCQGQGGVPPAELCSGVNPRQADSAHPPGRS